MKRIFAALTIVCLLLLQIRASSAQDIPTGSFLGSYYNGRNFETFVFNKNSKTIAFEWWRRSPGAGVTKDNFSARWQGRFDFTAGDWQFNAKSDDGVRVFVDGEKVIDAWKSQHGVFYKSVKNMTAGTHLIVVEYFEAEEWAGVEVNWKKVSSGTTSAGPTAKPGTGSGASVPTTSPLYKSLYVSSCEELQIEPAAGDAPLEIEIAGAGYDPYGAIQSYIFNFGDDTPVLTQESSYATHIYEKPGNYNLALSIKDSKGNIRSANECKVTVKVGGYYKEGVGGYAEPTVIPATVSSLPKTGIFDNALWLILITIPMAGFGLLLNRKFSKL